MREAGFHQISDGRIPALHSGEKQRQLKSAAETERTENVQRSTRTDREMPERCLSTVTPVLDTDSIMEWHLGSAAAGPELLGWCQGQGRAQVAELGVQ